MIPVEVEPGSNRTPLRFRDDDRIVVEGKAWRTEQKREDGWLLTSLDTGDVRLFTHAKLRDLERLRMLEVEFYALRPGGPPEIVRRGPRLADLHDALRHRCLFRLAYCRGLDEIFADPEIDLKKTEASVKENILVASAMASQHFDLESERALPRGAKTYHRQWQPSAKTLLIWWRAYKKFGLSGLLDDIDQRGGAQGALHEEARRIMNLCIDRLYMSRAAPNVKYVWRRILRMVRKLNVQREDAGLLPVKPPHLSTVYVHVLKRDAFAVIRAREGVEAARRAFRPVLQGDYGVRPLEIVHIDEHELDVFAIAEAEKWQAFIDEEFWKKIVTKRHRLKYKISVAICAVTKVVLAVVVSPTAGRGATAIQTLEQILTDKGRFATSVGAVTVWFMCGRPERILTDHLAFYRSSEFKARCDDLSISLERPQAGDPAQRGVMERLFGTVEAGCISILPGSIKKKKDKEATDFAQSDAAFGVDDLVHCLIRWVVDCYHNEEHSDLQNESPLAAWNRLTALYEVLPGPSAREFWLTFGVELIRKPSRKGVRVLGVDYHSEALARLFLREKGKHRVEIRWHPSDIGHIWVRIDETWTRVPSVGKGLDGVSAPSWLSVCEHIRSNYGTKPVPHDVVLQALEAIDARVDAARVRQGILLDEWTPERCAKAENGILGGVRFRPENIRDEVPREAYGYAIPEPDAVSDEADAPVPPEQVRDAEAEASPMNPSSDATDQRSKPTSTYPKPTRRPRPGAIEIEE